MKYVYPVIITKDENYFLVTVPDLPGLHTFGDSLADAIDMAQDAVAMWLWDAENKHEEIPFASEQSEILKQCDITKQFVTLVTADTNEYRKQNDTRAIKKTLSIPAWLNYQAQKANAPFSQILQQGLKEYLRIT